MKSTYLHKCLFLPVLNDLQEIFPGVTRSVIGIALDESNYNKEAAASVLSQMSSQKAPSQSVSPQVTNHVPACVIDIVCNQSIW